MTTKTQTLTKTKEGGKKKSNEANAEVKVEYQPSADSLVVNVTVTAPDEASLMSALRNLGVMQPEKIKPQVKRGEGDRTKEITVSFSLTDKLS